MITPIAQRSASQLASAYQMGTLIKEYKTRQGAGIPLVVLGGMLACLALATIGSHAYVSGLVVVLILVFLVGLGFLGMGLLAIAGRSRYRHTRLCIYDYGLVHIHEQKLVALHWSEIQEVWLIIRIVRYKGQSSYRLSGYTLRKSNGEQLTLSSKLWSLDGPGRLIEHAVVQEQLPRVLDIYRVGKPLQFGPITLERQGLMLTTGSGEVELQWNQISRIDVFDEGIILEQEQQPPYKIVTASVPNLCVFLSLVHALKSGQGIHAEARYDWILQS